MTGDRRERTEVWWIPAILPFGLFAWMTFAYLGVRTGRKVWLLWSVVYLLGIAGALGLNVLGHDENQTLGMIASLLCMAIWFAAMLHALLIRDEVRARLAEVHAAQDARLSLERRRKAIVLARTEPEVARELKIGSWSDDNDYGLVDVNDAPAWVLRRLPGIEQATADRIVAHVEEAGGFVSLAELGHELDLPAATLSGLEPHVVFLARRS
jgi:DNA uptake protein ComE-like DNA-binding protein